MNKAQTQNSNPAGTQHRQLEEALQVARILGGKQDWLTVARLARRLGLDQVASAAMQRALGL